MRDLDETRHLARLRTVLEGVLELDEPERQAWLERMCVDEPELLCEVMDLLRRAEQGGAMAEFLGERS